MSRTFNRIYTLNKVLNDDIFKISEKLFIAAVASLVHLTYTFGTTDKDKITIVKKYKMVRNGFTDFMVVDNKGRHFNVNNSLWYWKWNSIEDWHNIKEGETINFRYYGLRVPFLGIFPNIYMSKEVTFSDSILDVNYNLCENENIKYNSIL